ncbi:hypothetical protein ACHAXR_005275 [Thalassiosira sp. AJA248-18]
MRTAVSADAAAPLKNRAASATSSSSSSTMELDSYSLHSKNQYSAHLLTRDLLSSSMDRLAKRCNLEDTATISDGMPLRRRRMVDLGSADGSSTMETLKFAMHCLKSGSKYGGMPLHITFEEHPASSKHKLQTTMSIHDEWFTKNDVERDIIMQSFYQPLFEPATIDFMMSYICLHWLDTTDVSEGGSIAEWKTMKRLSATNENDTTHLEWTHINDATTPKHIQEEWRENLAHLHLAKFLSLRSKELRPGAELLLVMVGHPHEFVTPSDGGPGPLTRAMKRCIDRGELREDVLHRTIIPYFLRTVDDIEATLKIAETLEMGDNEKPGALLELVECRSVPAITKGDDDTKLGGAFELFWSIHSHSIANANPTKNELECIKKETRTVFDEIYDSDVGIPSSFVACVLRRRTREQWRS